MGYDIILGRNESDKALFGKRGLIYLGKGYVTMGTATSLSNTIYLDVVRSHVILLSGKRGSGKSYSLGVIAEELSNLPPETSQNIASLIFDTMGIFWTMKYPNKKDTLLLKEWDLEAKNLPIKVYVPFGKAEEYKEKGIPIDSTFALKLNELGAEDWITLFNMNFISPPAVLISRIITELNDKVKDYTFEDIHYAIEQDKKTNPETKAATEALFYAADTWGIFSRTKQGTEITDLVNAGTTTILDTSVYSAIGTYNIRALIISLVTRKLFKNRMEARKEEEILAIARGADYLRYTEKKQDPLLWLFIDEAHEFLPKDEITPATAALKQVLREGRQPGISIALATQQPGKIHTDAITQSDIVISHRVTAKQDVDALGEITQSYVLSDIQHHLATLPKLKGSALILDDNSERLYPIRIRPRFTWHGGEAPIAIRAETTL